MASYHLKFREVILDRGVEHNDYSIAIQDWEDDMCVVSSDLLENLDEEGARNLYGVDEFQPIVKYGVQLYGRCVCTKEIIHHYRIRNTKNNYRMFIGSDCFEHIGNPELTVPLMKVATDMKVLLNIIQQPDQFHFKIPSSKTIEYCATNAIITADEQTFCSNFTNGYKRNDKINMTLDEVERVIEIYLKIFRRLSPHNAIIQNVNFQFVVKNVIQNNTNVHLVERWYREYYEDPVESYLNFHFDPILKIGVFYPNINGYKSRRWNLLGIKDTKHRNVFKLIWEIKIDWRNTWQERPWKEDTIYCGEFNCSSCGKKQQYDITKHVITPMKPPRCKLCA